MNRKHIEQVIRDGFRAAKAKAEGDQARLTVQLDYEEANALAAYHRERAHEEDDELEAAKRRRRADSLQSFFRS